MKPSSQSAGTLENFRQGLFSKTIAATTVSFFAWTFCLSQPALAVQTQLTAKQKAEAAYDAMVEKTPDDKFTHRLQKLKDSVEHDIAPAMADREQHASLFRRGLRAAGFGPDALTGDERTRLAELQQSIQSAWQDVDGNLSDVDKHLKDKHADPVILQRQKEARNKIQGDYKNLQNLITVATRSHGKPQADAVTALQAFLSRQQFEKGHSKLDPKHLPFGTPEPNKKAPADDSVALWQKTHAAVQVASNGALPPLTGVFAPRTPTDAELAETIDTTQTQAIKDKATALHNNPVEIYTWVANNIRFVPSFGSIQGADMTLQTLRGNDMDTASLLIALLRAAHIPARYAYGTVQLPVAQVMNWVGGVTVPEAAANLMQQGGIPTQLVATNGVITDVKFEHTWVEAWVDFEPSRGMKNVQGDSWIPMDASFKQYDYTQPTVDLKTAVPFDAQSLANTIQQKSTVNEQEGWVQNVPQADIQNALTNYQTQLQTYLTTQQPNATVGDVLGIQSIKVKQVQPLSAGLPYQLIAKQSNFSEVADSLRLKFKYELYTSVDSSADQQLFVMEQPTVKLAGKKLAMSFKPATQQDADLIASYIPAADPTTGQIDPTKLPSSLPGYLIHLVPEFTLDNDTVATSTTQQTMGTEMVSVMGYQFSGKEYETTQNLPIAGQYEAVALDLQGISPDQANKLKTNLEATKAKIDAQNITDLTKHQVVGDLLYATIMSYFALNDVQDDIMNTQENRSGFRSPSYGLFRTDLTTQYYFGMPRNVSASGLMTDVDHYKTQVVQKDNDSASWIQNNRMQGARVSQMEASVPEQMYSTASNPAHGVAAVTAIQIAASQGQKIFTITQSNVDNALSQITLPQQVIVDIQNAVAAGKEVTTHQTPIDFYGKPQVGYLVIDPQTGAGGYHIYGGADGAAFNMGLFAGSIICYTAFMPDLQPQTVGFVAEIIAATVLPFMITLLAMAEYRTHDSAYVDRIAGCFLFGLIEGISVVYNLKNGLKNGVANRVVSMVLLLLGSHVAVSSASDCGKTWG